MFRNWAGDEKVQNAYAEPVYSTEEAVRELLDKYISAYEKEDTYRWAVTEKGKRDYFYRNGEYEIPYLKVNTGKIKIRRGAYAPWR